MTGRREQREELESTWNVWDATRPIRKADMEQAERCSFIGVVHPAAGRRCAGAEGHAGPHIVDWVGR